MAYYPDLSRPFANRTVRAVGWLDERHRFQTARPPMWVINKLWIYCEHLFGRAGGFHECTLGGCPGPYRKLRPLFERRRPSAHTIRKRHDALRASFLSGVLLGAPEPIKTHFLDSLEQALRSDLRGYSKMTVGVHPKTGQRIHLGYADIYIFGKRGKIYKAPNMVYHYVTAHHYKPPDEFVEALKISPCPPEPEYCERLKRAGFPAMFMDVFQKIWEEKKSQRDAKRKSV